MKITYSVRALAAVAGTMIWSGAGDCASFTGLGDLPGGAYRSVARAVSADGSVVVGASRVTDFGDFAFRWTAESGIVALTDATGGHFDSLIDAYGISADGSVIAGVGRAGTNTEGFRWTAASGYVGLGDLPGGVFHSQAFGISSDGSTVVGSSYRGGPGGVPQERAFRWNSGTMTDLGSVPANTYSAATKVSADGSVVIGTTETRGFRWTSATGMVEFAAAAGFTNPRLFGISGDGSVIVGNVQTANGSEAFRWTAAGGYVGLGDLAGGTFGSAAIAISADGSVITGSGRIVSGEAGFIWDAEHGMRDLRELLVNDFGLGDSLTGWKLTNPQALSADGTVVVGYGINPSGNLEGFLANLGPGEPTEPLAGDFNDDGRVDAADYTVWRDKLGTTFALPNETASPGTVDAADYAGWKANFGTIEGGGALANVAVPEPGCLAIFSAAAVAGLATARRQH